MGYSSEGPHRNITTAGRIPRSARAREFIVSIESKVLRGVTRHGGHICEADTKDQCSLGGFLEACLKAWDIDRISAARGTLTAGESWITALQHCKSYGDCERIGDDNEEATFAAN